MKIEGMLEWKVRRGKNRLCVGEFEIINVLNSVVGKKVIIEIKVEE